MKMQTIFGMLLVLAFAGNVAFAATTSAPILEISSYSTVPTEVYAGTLGYLQITLSNTGSATAESVTAYYDIDGTSKSVSSGEISTGSTALLSVPFKIKPEAAGSIQPINVDIFYSYTSSSGIANKKTSLSVPIEVLQQSPLEARTISLDKSAIGHGEKLSLELELKNTGGVVNSLVITVPSNSSFSLDGTTKKSVGNIAANSSVKVELALVASSETAVGTYNVPITFTYQDALQRPSEDTLYVGPVSVLEAGAQYRLALEPVTTAEIGSQAVFRLTLENTGSSVISATVDVNSTSVFTPIGMQKLYFDSVPAGGKSSQEITIGISSSQSAGYYTLPLRLTTNTGQAATFNTGVFVQATPEVTVTVDSGGVQISNTGNSQIRSVYASAKYTNSKTGSESFIGTLNVDDFASLALPSTNSSMGGFFGTGSAPQLEVVIRFKDSNNIEHLINKTLDSGSAVFTGQSTGTGSAASGATNFGNRQSNPLSFILGGGRAVRSPSSGPDIVTIAGWVVVIAVGGFLFYKYYWQKRKGASQKPAGIAEGRKMGIVESIKARIGISGKQGDAEKLRRKS